MLYVVIVLHYITYIIKNTVEFLILLIWNIIKVTYYFGINLFQILYSFLFLIKEKVEYEKIRKTNST